MEYFIQAMDQRAAEQISLWTYPKPYDLYDATFGPETTAELLDGTYFRVIVQNGDVVGFCCIGASAQVPAGLAVGAYSHPTLLDMGLGMRPDLTGHGLGYAFVGSVIDFLSKWPNTSGLRLTVATFNQRAISVYQHHRFVPAQRFFSQRTAFMTMERPNQTLSPAT